MPGRTTTGTPPTFALSPPRRRQPSSKVKTLRAVKGLLPGSGGKPATTSRSVGKNAKAGVGVAVLTAAAGAAFKNRDRLSSLLKRRGDGAADPSPIEHAPMPAEAADGSTSSEAPHVAPPLHEDVSSPTWRAESSMREQEG
jgi:hypothetical protein